MTSVRVRVGFTDGRVDEPPVASELAWVFVNVEQTRTISDFVSALGGVEHPLYLVGRFDPVRTPESCTVYLRGVKVPSAETVLILRDDDVLSVHTGGSTAGTPRSSKRRRIDDSGRKRPGISAPTSAKKAALPPAVESNSNTTTTTTSDGGRDVVGTPHGAGNPTRSDSSSSSGSGSGSGSSSGDDSDSSSDSDDDDAAAAAATAATAAASVSSDSSDSDSSGSSSSSSASSSDDDDDSGAGTAVQPNTKLAVKLVAPKGGQSKQDGAAPASTGAEDDTAEKPKRRRRRRQRRRRGKGGDEEASTAAPASSTPQQQRQPKSRAGASQKSPAADPGTSKRKGNAKGNAKGPATPNPTLASAAQQPQKPKTGRGVVYADLDKLEGAPRKGDRLAFKHIVMSLSYTPEQSGWKVGDVVSYSPDSTTVSIKMSMQVAANSVVPIGGGDPRVHGKFEFGIAEEMAEPAGGKISFEDDIEEVLTLELSELIDPRLVPQ